ncbi:MAG TPA: hypothetical protein VEL31_29355 [Ktedonobacteraceae bacterium]|nr:hypothetical protein [Ktedonobacteraceae bacterium]
MDEQPTSDNIFETRLDISVSVNLAVESRSDPTEGLYSNSRALIEQELIDLQKNGLRPEFLALLDKQTGERIYKFTSNRGYFLTI